MIILWYKMINLDTKSDEKAWNYDKWGREKQTWKYFNWIGKMIK